MSIGGVHSLFFFRGRPFLVPFLCTILYSDPISHHPQIFLPPHDRRYRFYLTRDKRALTKVMRATDWTNQAEARQAMEVMEQWETIEIEDALELLGKDFAHPAPRRYAVQRLEQVSFAPLFSHQLPRLT